MSGRRDGFVLIAALWLLIAIATLNLALGAESRSRRLQAANLVEHTHAMHAANVAWLMSLANLSTLVNANSAATWSYSERIGGAVVNVVVRPAGCCLNVNEADETQLIAFFAALGASSWEARTLAHSILDWRDGDDDRRLYGAETIDYLTSDLRELPKNGRFEDIEDLQHVHGMTERLWSLSSEHIRTRGSIGIDLQSAAFPVLMALPGFTAEAAQAVIAARKTGKVVNLFDIPQMISGQARSDLEAVMPQLTEQVAAARNEFDVVCAAKRGLGVVVIEGVAHVEGGKVVTQWKRVS